MSSSRDIKGFTLVELMVALVVTGVILSAVAALAFAMNTSADVGEDMALSQAQYRQAVLWLRDLIGNARLICAAPGDDLVVWKADTNGDNLIDVNEVVYIERGADATMVRLCAFETNGSYHVTIGDLTDPSTKASLTASHEESFTRLMPECSNVAFTCHRSNAGDPLPETRSVTISLDLTEDNGIHRYEIDAALRAWAGHLLSTDGTALVASDDD